MQTLNEALANSAKPKEKKQTDTRAKSFRTLAKVFGTCEVQIAKDSDGTVYVTDKYAAVRFSPESQIARDIVSVLNENAETKQEGRGRFKIRKSGEAFSFVNVWAVSAELQGSLFARDAVTEIRDFEAVRDGDLDCLDGAAEGVHIRLDAKRVAGLAVLCSTAAVFAESGSTPVQFRDGGRVFAVLMPIRIKGGA